MGHYGIFAVKLSPFLKIFKFQISNYLTNGTKNVLKKKILPKLWAQRPILFFIQKQKIRHCSHNFGQIYPKFLEEVSGTICHILRGDNHS